jgi:opacity protein-like surface antigen
MNNFTKYTILLAATSLCTINAANAVEKGKFYASGSYGVGFADKFDYKDKDGVLAVKKPSNANVFGAAIGYGVTDNIRAELSYNGFYGMKYKDKYTAPNQDVEGDTKFDFSQKQTANTIFFNTYYETQKFSKIKPYIGGGIGVSVNKAYKNSGIYCKWSTRKC